MKTRTFENGLIIRHRRSAIFFEGKANIESYRNKEHDPYISITELSKTFRFLEEEFKDFRDYCNQIALEVWSIFTPKEADSWASDYDDYYDKDFDNNGSLSVRVGVLFATGPYTQLKADGEIIRLIKFNKRTFESFIYDLNKLNVKEEAVHEA